MTHQNHCSLTHELMNLCFCGLCVCVQWAEYVLFASLLVAVSIIFSIMAYFYKYIDPAEIEAQIKREQELEPEDKREKETELNELKQTKM